jgi:hypothetical protein
MTASHEVISAFLDDEPFESRELADALADPSGRRLLIDLVALRHIVQPDEGMPVRRARPRPLLRFAAAAAVLVALVGGYAAGARQGAQVLREPASRESLSNEAPAPTRVVQSPTNWQNITGETR